MNVLFKTEDYQYKVSSSENQTEFDKLYLTLMDMLEKNQINEAEDMLFDHCRSFRGSIADVLLCP